ncbi:hypothetical protein BJP25_24395 [Actinokineospora bangkokensis]|uniref:Uncharacterized protein n=1 Tax=Actinokineospora bangkokensis TaxID=1193682 RepID=A0A1Q9LIT1_9PSEU|nr:hypothetical protein BJP25_24395 [Actinokineospora bangkokensis]
MDEGRVGEIQAELRALRRGLGVNDTDVVAHLGDRLREVCGVQPGDTSWTARERVLRALSGLTDRLPEPHREIARVALGFDSEPGLRYTDRLGPLERKFDRDTRTIQRRSNNALYLLAQCAAEPAPASRGHRPGPPWHTARLNTDLILQGDGVEVTETRTIVSHRPDLAEIEHSMTVVPPPGTPPGPLSLETMGIDAVAGGEVLNPHLLSASRAAFTLRPPHPLAEGDEHEFQFRVRVERISPLYMCTPTYPCDRFTVKITFDPARLPTTIQVVEGDLAIEAADPTLARPTLALDPSGEASHTFEDLEPYRSYGLLWQYAD